ncbi:lipopolysaccharide biosynthesis protein [Lactococcus nasutitermitis]|uniref:Lipopolysaccharide biosynthesis protein n=1 Tax=Lactococcus nasutitermitis TaxID=1652957 RepID=A0ABV9JEX3_9LACT|nr:lipopolysaccharide biosynthesis protein [Lactococcus nasutitermitis]
MMNTKLKTGFIFTSLGIYSNFLLQIIIQMVLSRLLTPKQFGLVAVMQVFIIFFAMMIESGMGPAIIQNKLLTFEDNRVLFDFSALFGLSIAVIFGFFGIVLAILYHNHDFYFLTWVQAISIFFNGLNIVPTAILNKAKRFKAVNFSLVLANLCAGIIGVTLAFLGGGVYALIISAITASIINFLLNHFFSKVTFTRHFNMAPLKSVWTFSKNQFGFNFVNYFSRNSDNMLIGKFMGEAALANYSKAYQLLMLPNTLFTSVVNPVLQPVLSEYQDDVDYIRQVYFKIVHILALIGIPLSIFLSTTARQIILCMFGGQWSAAIFPFSILSITVWSQMIVTPVGAIFQARNHSRKLWVTGLFTASGLVSSIIIGVLLGSINTVAICLTIGFLYSFCVNYYRLIKHSLNGKLLDFFKEFITPVILGGVIFIVLELEKFIDPSNLFYSLILRGVIFIFAWLLFIFFSSERKVITEIIKKR